jgi:hypothetical protein
MASTMLRHASRTLGSIQFIMRGAKPLLTSDRSRPCRGGSMFTIIIWTAARSSGGESKRKQPRTPDEKMRWFSDTWTTSA